MSDKVLQTDLIKIYGPPSCALEMNQGGTSDRKSEAVAFAIKK